MWHRTEGLRPAQQVEMRLVAVQPGEEYHPGFIGGGGSGEQMSGQRDGRGKDFGESVSVTGVEPGKRCAGRGGNSVENTEEGIAVAVVVAADQNVVVEVVAGEHSHAVGQPAAKLNLPIGVQQGDLDPVDPALVGCHDLQHGVGCGVEICAAPVPPQCGVESCSEPVQHDWAGGLAQYLLVDPLVVVLAGGQPGQVPARHQHRCAARPLDPSDLFDVGIGEVIQGPTAGGVQLVGDCPEGEGATDSGGFRAGAGDEFLRLLPGQATTALGRVHTVRHTETEAPQVPTEGQGGVP